METSLKRYKRVSSNDHYFVFNVIFCAGVFLNQFQVQHQQQQYLVEWKGQTDG